jgi:hypothetical protein
MYNHKRKYPIWIFNEQMVPQDHSYNYRSFENSNHINHNLNKNTNLDDINLHIWIIMVYCLQIIV